MQLVKATSKDIQALLEIEKTAKGLKIYSGYFTEEGIKEWLDSDIVYLIKKEETIVGSISYEVKDEKHAYISGLIVKPEFQKQGLGSQAIQLLLEELKKFKQVSLVVHPDNHAVRLYESLGFVSQGCKENYYGDGEPRLIMVKNN